MFEIKLEKHSEKKKEMCRRHGLQHCIRLYKAKRSCDRYRVVVWHAWPFVYSPPRLPPTHHNSSKYGNRCMEGSPTGVSTLDLKPELLSSVYRAGHRYIRTTKPVPSNLLFWNYKGPTHLSCATLWQQTYPSRKYHTNWWRKEKWGKRHRSLPNDS